MVSIAHCSSSVLVKLVTGSLFGVKLFFIFFTDDLGDIPAGTEGSMQSTPGIYPMTHHIKIL
jgi:hypothetical protein